MEEQNNQVGYVNKNGSYNKGKSSRNNSNDLSSVVFGKLPPQSLELEEAVLGGILIDHEAFPKIVEVLKAECFYKEAHQVIFSAAKALFQATQPIDRLTVFEQMQRMGTLERIGGNPYYLVQLTEGVSSSAHIESHARLILQKYVLREMIGISTEVITDAYAGTSDPLNLLDKAQQNLFNINQASLSRSFEGLNTLAGKLLKHLEQMRERGGMTGITSGMAALDAVTSGWQRSDLIIIAARPAMGKTAFTLSLAHNAAKAGFPVAIFSLEMANLQLVQRLLSLEGNIEGGRMRDGKLSSEDWEKLPNAIDRLSRLPIYIDDTPGINIFELRAKCRRLKAQHKIEMVIIDYLQLMTGGEATRGGNREQEVGMISRSLKGLAKELNVPVIALAQLSRAVETRGGSKKPQLSDLRECVTGDTRVVLSDGRLVKIQDLVGKKANVLSMDPLSEQIVEKEADLVWPVGKKKVYEVKLASGRSIKATAEHRLYAFEGWKTVGELKAGDRLALAHHLPEPANPIQMEDERIILLAHLMGDGSYLSNQPLRYTTASEANSYIVKTCAQKAFGSIVNRHESKKMTWHQLVFSNNGNRWHPAGLNLWLREIGVFNERSHEKHVPDCIFQLNNEQVALFLKHLWATDGTVYVPKSNIRHAPAVNFSTNSKQLANDVAMLLLRFSIVARIKTVPQGEKPNQDGDKYRDMFMVEVSGKKYQEIFIKRIGGYGAKSTKIDELEVYLSARKSNTNIDTIPIEVFDYVQAKMKEKNFIKRDICDMRGTLSTSFKHAPSKETLASYAVILQDDNLKRLVENDLFWDKILSIEFFAEEDVFDLTVPETSSWLADGIISHNSGSLEQDSDIVSFIYRPEYYGLTEYEDGAPTKGMADILISKHRNGNVGEVRLKFEGQYSRFADPNQDAGNFTDGDPNVITISSRMNTMDSDFDLSKPLTGVDSAAKADFPYGTAPLPRSPLDFEIGLNPNARPEDGFSPF
jgi:replicative DNA helicase